MTRDTRYHPLSRKDFLALATGTLAATAVPQPSAAAVGPIATKPIPKSGENLPIIGLGTSRVFDVNMNPSDLAPRRGVIQAMVTAGATVIDTAPSYGKSEAVVGTLLDQLDVRDKVFLATKVLARSKEEGLGQMDTSINRLNTDVVDLNQVHNLVETETQLKSMRAWRDEGRIRYIGITHFFPWFEQQEALGPVMEKESLDFVQLNYSLAVRQPENRLLPMAADKGVAVLVNVPFGGFGRKRLFNTVKGKKLPGWAADLDINSWAQFFLKFIVSHPAVTCVIPATSKPHHMVDNLNAGRGRMPSAADRKKMSAFFDNI